MNVKAYIISYFGSKDKPEERQVRVENHKQQIDFWKAYCPEMQIQVLAQDYNEDEFIEGVEYVVHKGDLLTPGQARNVLLENFYSDVDFRNNHEWALFMDNDAVLKSHDQFYHTRMNICKVLENFPDNFEGVDLFFPHWDGRPGDGAFKDKYRNLDKNYINVKWDRELCFDRKFGSMKGTMFFLRRNEQRVKFNEKFTYIDGNLLVGEDDFFALECAMKGLKTYILRNILLKEYTSPSTHAGAQNTRKAEMDKGDKIFREAYGLPESRGQWYKYVGRRYGIYMDKRIVRPYLEEIKTNTLEELFT